MTDQREALLRLPRYAHPKGTMIRLDDVRAALPSTPQPEGLDAYLDQLEPPTPRGYGDDPEQAFKSGFGWAIDAILDYLDGTPWVGGVPPMTHDRNGQPLAARLAPPPPEPTE